MRFIALQHKSTETKMENNSFAGTCEQADRLNTRQGKCDDKKRNGKSEKKKRCGFIMFVIESAAAGCGISNDSLARILNQSPEA